MNLQLSLNRAHVGVELGRLLRVYKRPAHAPEDATEFATDYAQICAELSDAQFTGACDAALRSPLKWMPKPGELLALGRAITRGPTDLGSLEAQYREWEHSAYHDPVMGKWTPCPVCGARMQETLVRIERDGYEVYRLKVLHNATVHWKTGVGFTMAAAPGTGGGRYEQKIMDQRPTTVSALPLTDEQVERAGLQAEGA